MLRARVGQLRDRGSVAFAREAASKMSRLLGEESSHHDELGRLFDAEYGTDTCGILQPWDSDIPDSLVGQAVHYATANVDVFVELLSRLDITHADYTFVDLGCGKGRALLLASSFPFKQIIGVELSPQLHHTSLLNIRRFRSDSQRCMNIVSLCENATLYTFPPENTVLYLFNPFGADTLRSVVAHLDWSLRTVPRRVYVIYVKPVHRRVFDQSGLFSILNSVQGNLTYVNNRFEGPQIASC